VQPRACPELAEGVQALGKGETSKQGLKGRKRRGANLRQCRRHKPVKQHLRITRVTLSRVLNGKAGISADMAIRLAAALVHHYAYSLLIFSVSI
jgi:Helix-turn-helix